MDWDDMAVVGRVARVHGLRGDVVIDPETDFPEERFEPGRVVYRRTGETVEELKLRSCRVYRGRPIVAFDGVDSIDEAEHLAGIELRVPVEWLEQLPAGSYYHHDLVGCEVQTPDGNVVGKVDRVDGEGGTSRLVLATSGGEVLVPLVADICRTVDVARKMIVIEPPDGLLEVNGGRWRERGGDEV